MGTEFHFYKLKRAMGMDGGMVIIHKIVNVFNTTKLYT